jgi:hypothetical protein
MAYIRPSGIGVVENLLLENKLPEGFAIYDFGGGFTVAPAPDLDGSEFLTDHCSAIERVRKTEEDPIRITAFRYDLQFVTSELLQKLMYAAVESNKTQTTPFQVLKLESPLTQKETQQ